jgi:hypothetical protein
MRWALTSWQIGSVGSSIVHITSICPLPKMLPEHALDMQTRLRSKVTLLFMMLGLLLAVPTVAFAAQTRSSVPANLDLPGYSTGINIHEGDRVVIKADGLVDLDCDPAAHGWDNVPPDGVAGTAGHPALVLPSANQGALLGRIGTSGDWFLVGESKKFTASTSGQLYLIVNDTLGGFTDNSCSHFTAKIRVKELRT